MLEEAKSRELEKDEMIAKLTKKNAKISSKFEVASEKALKFALDLDTANLRWPWDPVICYTNNTYQKWKPTNRITIESHSQLRVRTNFE